LFTTFRTIKYSSNIAQINKVKTINIERELTELQNKKQASNKEEIENIINLLENEVFFVFVLIFLLVQHNLYLTIEMC
jgi:hypothetical protein